MSKGPSHARQAVTPVNPADVAAARLAAVERRLALVLRVLAILTAHDSAIPMALRERLAHEVEEGA